MTDVKSKLLQTTALKGQKGNALFLFSLLISVRGRGGQSSGFEFQVQQEELIKFQSGNVWWGEAVSSITGRGGLVDLSHAFKKERLGSKLLLVDEFREQTPSDRRPPAAQAGP